MTGEYLAEVIAQARDWDDVRPRSEQRELGWSGMAGCRSWMGYKIRGDWPTDDEENWRAIAGTALHAWLGAVRLHALGDPDVSFELEVSYGGVTGHADEVDWRRKVVTDYKFPRLASARVWDDPDALDELFIQVHGYAAGVIDTPRWRELHGDDEDITVQMLVCPVDGTFPDWACYSRPFSRQAADDALRRLQQVVADTEAGEDLPRDKPWFFCERFCEYFTACRGGMKPSSRFEEIRDPELAAAIERYGLAGEQAAAADKAKKELLPLIKGLRGTARGWRVAMSKPGAGKLVYDEDAIARQYERSGLDIPLRPAEGRPSRLMVTREKT